MLTLRKISVNPDDLAAAARAAEYPLERSDSPDAFRRAGYYAGADQAFAAERANSMWLGSPRALAIMQVRRGAEVTQDELALALRGMNADGQQVRKPGRVKSAVEDEVGALELVGEDGKPLKRTQKRVNSVDLTFSAPKSVSAVWTQARPELRAKIEHAMIKAANAASTHMLQTKGVVNAYDDAGDRILIPARGWVGSVTLDVTARKARSETVPSPQLHVHSVIVAVERQNSTLATPQTEELFKYDAPLEGGAVGRAVLADELRAMGFQIRAFTGRNERFFEIDGVPQGLIDAWSARAKEVEERAREMQAETGERPAGATLGAVAMWTRAAKQQGLSPAEIMDAWDACAQEFGFGEADVEALRRGVERQRPLEERLAQARSSILRRIWEQGPTVSHGQAVAIAFEAAPLGLSLGEAGGLLEEMRAGGELIALEGGQVTTRAIRERERYVLRVAGEAGMRRERTISKRAVQEGTEAAERALGEGKRIEGDQKDAVVKLTSGGDWLTLTGRAGTGKGPVLDAVAAAHRADGWNVIACAVDGATAQRLGHQIRGPASTLEQVLVGAQRETLELNRRTLIVIDEASKVGLAHWVEVAKINHRFGVRVLAVGHTGQLDAIELPGTFEAMLEHPGVPAARLRKVRRHLDPANLDEPHPWLERYLNHIDDDEADLAVALLREKGALALHDTREEAMEGLVKEWDERRREYEDVREALLEVHGSNQDVDKLNELAQGRRQQAHELAGDGIKATDRRYLIYENDVVMLQDAPHGFEPHHHGGRRQRRVENGTEGIVESVDRERDIVHVRLDEPGTESRRVAIDLGSLRKRLNAGERNLPSLRLSYAGHPYRMLGVTRKLVGVLDGHHTQSKQGSYSADARAEQVLFKHADRESLGRGHGDCHGRAGEDEAAAERTDEHRYRLLAKRMRTSQNRAASIMNRATTDTIVYVLPEIETAPGLPLRGDVREPEQDALWELEARAAGIPDPLDDYRDVLGERRADAIGQLAGGSASAFAVASRDRLQAELEHGRWAFGQLDRPGALRSLSIERDQQVAGPRMERALAWAEELDAEAGDRRGWRMRNTRSDLTQAAEARRRDAEHERRLLDRLEREQLELRLDGRHIDDWLEEHGDAFARGIAAERELARRAHELAPELETDELPETRLELEATEPGFGLN